MNVKWNEQKERLLVDNFPLEEIANFVKDNGPVSFDEIRAISIFTRTAPEGWTQVMVDRCINSQLSILERYNAIKLNAQQSFKWVGGS